MENSTAELSFVSEARIIRYVLFLPFGVVMRKVVSEICRDTRLCQRGGSVAPQCVCERERARVGKRRGGRGGDRGYTGRGSAHLDRK